MFIIGIVLGIVFFPLLLLIGVLAISVILYVTVLPFVLLKKWKIGQK